MFTFFLVKNDADKSATSVSRSIESEIGQLPDKFVEANSAGVDVITGATVTTRERIYEMENQLNPDSLRDKISGYL